jgi:glycosyltransferase involved in cell wall biosynthesis
MTTHAPRLLIVTTVGGTVSHFLLPYVSHFRSLGWTVDAASSRDRYQALVEASVDRWHELALTRSARALVDPRNIARLRSLIDAGRYDIVHVHTPIAAFAVRLAVGSLPRDRRPATVYTAHGFHFMPGQPRRTDRPYRAAERIGGRFTDRLIVINDTDARSAVDYNLVPSERVVQMPGIGIDLGWYRPSPAIERSACVLRNDLGVPHGDHLVAMLAEFAPGKNHQTLIEAFARIDRNDTHLAFAGEGDPSIAAKVREQCRRLGLAQRVHFLGEIDDVRPLISASSATTLPSRREGLSRAVLESLAMGVPVLGSDIRGITESVAPDGGILIDPDDVDGIADGLSALLDRRCDHFDPVAVRSRMRNYETKHLISLHEDLYRGLLAARQEPRIGSQ